VSSDSPSVGDTLVMRALCALVVVIIIAAVVYAAWIAISNFSRIGV
jgi:hypothetical protein